MRNRRHLKIRISGASLQQALARAEEARARGNALYAVADYNGALEVYSQALELAPPAYVTVEKSSIEDAKQSEAEESETLNGTSSGNVAKGVEPEGSGGGGSDRGSSSDNERLVSQKGLADEGEGSSPGFRTEGARRVRPPKVLDPKTGKLVPDEKSAESGDGASASERVGGGAETGAKAGGGEEQREDQEAISCRAACHANRAACFVQLVRDRPGARCWVLYFFWTRGCLLI
jgi:tetratricopeptide (TPR) repeat protein